MRPIFKNNTKTYKNSPNNFLLFSEVNKNQNTLKVFLARRSGCPADAAQGSRHKKRDGEPSLGG